MDIQKYLAGSEGRSQNMAYLESVFPGQAALPILGVAKVISMPPQTMRNKILDDTFPIPSFRQGKRRLCLKIEVAAYLDRVATTPPKPKLGARTKADRIQAQAANEGGSHDNRR